MRVTKEKPFYKVYAQEAPKESRASLQPQTLPFQDSHGRCGSCSAIACPKCLLPSHSSYDCGSPLGYLLKDYLANWFHIDFHRKGLLIKEYRFEGTLTISALGKLPDNIGRMPLGNVAPMALWRMAPWLVVLPYSRCP